MNIIFDNDVSSDDLTVLIYFLSNPNIVLKLITVAGTGEAHGPAGARNIADICHMFNKDDIPIAYGSETPCSPAGKPFPDSLRKLMDEILKDKGVPSNPNPKISASAVEAMLEVLIKSKEPVTIVATGPLTNVAQLLEKINSEEMLEKYPELKSKIEKIVIMGGAVDVKGNIEALNKDAHNTEAEWNIYADPKAADIVFASGVPVTLVPLDATNQVPMTEEFYNSINQQIHPAFKLIHNFLKTIVDNFGMKIFIEDFYLWDQLAGMIAVNPKLANTEEIAIKMNLATAKTERVEKGTEGSYVINVAKEIPDAHKILPLFLDELKENLVNHNLRAPARSIFQPAAFVSNLVSNAYNMVTKLAYRN